ncbi:hypothetical protein SSX86_018117 [Deinandra increscens subsp. villosa]|uniref:Uncharacterized protein n=1 Tax=Deinandra increscens subsp. villosa TaxID=3103831 RepID=A0AAP0CVC9_9ASTR
MEGDLVDLEKKNKSGGNKRERDDVMGRGLEKRMSGVVEEYSYSGDEMINGVKYEEEKDEMINGVKHEDEIKEAPAPAHDANGLFDQLITSLVNSPRSNQEDESKVNGDETEEKVNGDETEEKKINGDEEEEGDVIDNIVARLPRTLSEDTPVPAPAADEASILIHSIIHD